MWGVVTTVTHFEVFDAVSAASVDYEVTGDVRTVAEMAACMHSGLSGK